MTSIEPFTAPPGCAPHLRKAYENAINAHPPTWRSEPKNGEVFIDIGEAERRLRCFALATGFDIVRTAGGTKLVPGASFACYHHGEKSRNDRGLEDRVVRDEEGNIVSKRQRESTSVRQRGCNWSVRVSWKSIGKRGSSEKGFVLTIKSLNHEGHDLTENPLAVYSRHMTETKEYREVLQTASRHRIAVIPYSASRRVLEATKFGISLTYKQYYNTVRNTPPNREDSRTIEGLLVALSDADFIYRTRVEETIDENDVVVSRKLL